MISTTYDQRRETFRLVSRKIRFVLAVFGPPRARNETKGGLHASRSDAQQSISKEGRETTRLSFPCDSGAFFEARLAEPENEVFGMTPKKAKKVAQKST
jgi:hypothetical protein